MYTSSSNLLIPLPPTNPPQSSNKLLHFSPITPNYIPNKPLFVNSKKINPLVNPQFVPSKIRVSDSITGDGNCNKGFAIEDEEAAAIEAVSKIIEENGGGNVLKKEAYEMAMNSRNYVKLLVDGVNELDELEISMSGGDEEAGRISFEEKVYEMGKKKGDKGIVPFLESVVGLSLPSAMHLSRLLLASQQTLSRLVVKVKYVTEMFFSNNSDDYDDDEGRLGEIARRMMMRLSIPVDDDSLQQTLSFFEKTQARRGGLDMLGSKDASFYHMIRSFPRLLLLPLESRVKPIIEFLEDIGVPKRSMRNILLLYPPILFHDIEKDIKLALAKVSAENKDWGGILLKYPWILSTSIQRNHVQIRSLFDTNKVPKSSVDHAIKKWPQLLGCSIDKLTLMVEHFAELGISNRKLGQVIAKSPQILLRKPQDFQQVVYFLKELGLDEETVGRIVGRCPEIFATDIDRILKKKLEFLNRIGVSQGNFPRVIRKYPELFVCDVNKTLLPRMNYLIKIGLSKRDVTFMVCRFSPILGYSIKEVLRPKLEFLVKTMKKPTRDVVDYPRYFSYSLEKKIEPRYWQLKSRNKECSLKDMLSKNDEEFAAEFMTVETNLDPPVALM